jgi:hypothetical protein
MIPPFCFSLLFDAHKASCKISIQRIVHYVSRAAGHFLLTAFIFLQWCMKHRCCAVADLQSEPMLSYLTVLLKSGGTMAPMGKRLFAGR